MEQFSHFALVKRLAIGGMSELFVARDLETSAAAPPVVVKRLLPGMDSRPDVVDLFLTEADITVMLRHPNIVQVFESDEWDGQYYIAMELMDGPDVAELERLAHYAPLPIGMPLSLWICTQALDGLDYVHKARSPSSGRPLGIIHRDVSPENLFCTLDGRVKVADFGVAKLAGLEGFTSVGMGVKGKLCFMAPEQLRGDELDGRTDQYALALVLYELVTGLRAFMPGPGESDVALVERVREARFPKPRDLEPAIPRRLHNALLKALERKPGNRFKDCGEFAEALREVAGKDGLQADASHLNTLLRRLLPARFEAPTLA